MKKDLRFKIYDLRYKNGFTLSELLIVVALLALLAIIGFNFINYQTQIAKGVDKRRKDDLSRLKTAFEEYYSDHSCYPSVSIIKPCGETATQLAPYLRIIPCDPKSKKSYTLVTEDSNCPQWFKIYTTLDNQADAIINNLGCRGGCGPKGPAQVNSSSGVTTTITSSQTDYSYNYGVSSSNTKVGCEDQYYSGWVPATPEWACNIKSSDGTPPGCNPYFCGSGTCKPPLEECK